ncbi:Na(+)/H(+) antiporter subunit C [Micromonospora peucetia]|uniref:Multisubunit sodium/proton antiporter, MrpC subunit n=1 Tax=Micromonospora peucetia TaxID=47871 RepID=A0A1C6U3G9_9ACTN|nr:Na(+)/H(+) antiporter subunit C [Micromonospora peucetia]MCX4386006.1 Na(+)/H(+) antiporter subunit C [Micromonospora peucetia]WSA33374.1 Na(+)/H(+) antiporter subunit C [Micromonospora peucetia]SCL48577.1 multisubunit sodium/proton antiporter, MrpC subunit [Micromonospora peucetia]
MSTGVAGPTLVLVVAAGVLVGCGVTLLLERSLSRILLGVILFGNGVNVLILLGGRAGAAPLVGTAPAGTLSDALPQAMILTAIVITFGLTAFLLAVSYRSWYLTGDDEVPDDIEDREVRQAAERNELAAADLGGEGPDADPEQVDPEPPRRLRRGDGPG